MGVILAFDVIVCSLVHMPLKCKERVYFYSPYYRAVALEISNALYCLQAPNKSCNNFLMSTHYSMGVLLQLITERDAVEVILSDLNNNSQSSYNAPESWAFG